VKKPDRLTVRGAALSDSDAIRYDAESGIRTQRETENVVNTVVRRALAMALLLLLLVVEALPMLTVVAQNPVATPPATPVNAPALPAGVTAAEQALADKWVPIAMLRTQPEECSPVGEPYVPIAVEVTLDNSDIQLRRRREADERSDPVITAGPSAQDLAAVPTPAVNAQGTPHASPYYLDLPGKSLDPGCVYEEWSRVRIAELGLDPAVYARIATEPGRPGQLALQYWFHYVFDDYNNSHESDWEMIQLTFDAGTVEEALDQEPFLLSYAQHGGGENADWGDGNIVLDDGRLVAYPAEGSHATYYGDAIWLAWGEGGSGFGCDEAQEELTRVPLQAIVIPREIDAGRPFAWALFPGRWGEYHPWEFNGPLSPNVGNKWATPISWTDDLRSVSYPVPHTTTFGMGPSEFFCGLSTMGGTLARRVQVAPQLILGLIGLAVAAVLLTTILTRRFLGGAIRLYARNWPTFLLSSVLLLAVAAFTTWLRTFTHHTLLADWVPADPDGEAAVSNVLDNGGIGFLLQFMLAGLVAPGVIAATAEIRAASRTDFREAVRRSSRRIPVVLGALLWNYGVALLMSLTIVLIPLALYRQVQWAYSPHAVVLDGARVRNARHMSRNAIKGDWLRTLGMAVLVTLVAGIPGPVIGMGLILLGWVSLDVGGYISSLVFAIVYPITIIASTLYYLWRKDQHAIEAEQPASAPWWERVRHALWGGHEPRRIREPAANSSAIGDARVEYELLVDEREHPAGTATEFA